MKVSFYLTRAKSKGETAIYTRICYSGFKVKYYLKDSIHPKYWNKATQRAKETEKFREYPEFNEGLDLIEATIKSIYRDYVNNHNREEPSPEILRDLLDKKFKGKQAAKERSRTFMGLLEEIKTSAEQGTRINPRNGKPITIGTRKTYITVYNHLVAYCKKRKIEIDFDSINLDFYTDYTEYLIKDLKLSSNTIGNHIKIIKIVMNEATERNINKNFAYKSKRFIKLKEKIDSIYLSEAEIDEMAGIDLSEDKKLERVRDLFMVACHTGLRYSDFSVLKPDNIVNGFITITQVKTGDQVVVPVHPKVREIIEKYDGTIPPSISNQKTNDYLKDIGKKMESLKITVTQSYTKGGSKVIKAVPKWKLLSTHAGRRSFATNQYLAGVNPITIMNITGHKSERTFLGYIKLTPDAHARELEKQWNDRNNLKVV